MKNYFSIILIFTLLYLFYFPITYLKYAREAETEFSGLLLSKAVDYAGEAAISACIEAAHLETEYIDETYMVMSPEKAATTFAQILCLSYGLPAAEYNIDSIKNKIPVMVLAANDGYHIALRQETGNGESALMWKLKKPYVVDTVPGQPDAGVMYGVELGMRHWYRVDKQTLVYSEGDGYTSLPFDRETMLQMINLAINRDVTAVLARYALDNNLQNPQSFYLPVSANTTGVRRVEKASLIVVLQDIDMDGIRPVTISTVNGMAVSQRRMVVGWTDGTGNKYYTYQGQADSTAQYYIELNGVMFVSVEDAARSGYVPKISY